jgi:hypothetical protein
MDDKAFEEELDKLAKQKADLNNKYGYLHCLLDKLAVKMHEDIAHDRIMGYSEDHMDALAIKYVNHMTDVIADYFHMLNERNNG